MIEPFKKNEIQSMSKLDRLKKEATQNEAGAGMGDAVAKTENIRNWREQCMGEEKLAAHLGTDSKRGLTTAQA